MSNKAINEDFGGQLLTTFNNPDENPVHMLFNQWWNHAPDDVKQAYVDQVMADPDYRSFIEEGHYAEPLDLDELRAMPAGSLGRVYHDWIVDNNLTASIATDYRDFHAMLEASGTLDGMPEEMKFAVLRGFQVHDFLHVLSGYNSSGVGEIALQAFSLAQMQFPYFGMWMSVITTRMTLCDPKMIAPMMDAISDGWRYGRDSQNLMIVKWESMLDQPLVELRAKYGVIPTALVERQTAA